MRRQVSEAGGRSGRRVAWVAGLGLAGLVAVATVALPSRAAAQQERWINFYRYVLDIEVPESPALVALDLAPTHAFRATSPKPIGADLLVELDEDGEALPVVAVQVSPYFLAGGGIRPLEAWRSGSLAGRLMRVLAKSVISVGGARDPLGTGGLRTAVALRSTLHDTHDPIGNTRLPERMQAALARLEGGAPPLRVEDVEGRSAEIRGLLADAGRRMRARRDWLLSAGMGVAGTLRSGAIEEDSIGSVDWTLWVNWQYTLGERFDFLTTARALRLFDSERDLRVAAGLQRKTRAADFLAEVFFDTTDDRVHGGLAAEAHLARRLGAVVSLSTEPSEPEGRLTRQLRVRALFRWYVAQGG